MKDKFFMDTRYGTIMGAAIFNNFVGMLEIPVDLLSFNSKSIVITSAFVVGVIITFKLTLFLNPIPGGWGILCALAGGGG